MSLELLALEQCEWDLLDRTGECHGKSPFSNIEDKDIKCAFYFGMISAYQGCPESTMDTIRNNLEAYAAGSFCQHLIELGGQR